MEFKADTSVYGPSGRRPVLIESDWNLKLHGKAAFCETGTVLIESDWNLKEKYSPIFAEEAIVLIESDWNLKIVRTFDDFKIGLKY